MADEFACETLHKTLCYGCVLDWSCGLRRTHHTEGMAREEKGEHVRLDWKGEEPPSNMNDGRAAAAPLALEVDWDSLFSHLFFFKGKHINHLELESLISLLRRVTREGTRAQRLLVLVESRVVLGAVSKGAVGLTKT